MPKFTAPVIESGYLSTEALNTAFQQIEKAFEAVLSRDGAAPNQMEADLDMNGHQLINTVSSSNPTSLVTLQSMQDYINQRASGLLIQRSETFTATASQTVFNLSQFTYVPGSGNIAVYVNGVRKFSPTTFTETDADTITFLAGQTVGDKVVVIQNEFLATATLPTHTHPWGQITNAPIYTTRWPNWTEVTGKPTAFTPAAHQHSAADITSGRLADARRGVYVQSSQPTATTVGDLWFW